VSICFQQYFKKPTQAADAAPIWHNKNNGMLTLNTSPTVRELIREHYNELSNAQRKFVNALLDDYPNAGLASITTVAQNASVSSPTVARTVQKLGFKGYPHFHQTLLSELQAKVSGPTQRRDNWASEAPETHQLNRFSQAITDNISQTFANIDTNTFDQAVTELADTSGHLYLVGGRITRALAEYAFTHFQAIRPNVTHMTASSATWPHYVLDMKSGDTLLLFDIRRYEDNLLRLAQLATEHGVRIVLITDQWSSPVSSVADFTFNCWVEVPSGWDSNTSTMLLLEAMIAAAQETSWSSTRDRYERLDQLFTQSKLFR